MEIYSEILAKALENGKIEVTFPGMTIEPKDIVEGKCYAALCKIKSVMDDPGLDDPECFQKIEAIVRTLEFLGVSSTRHDFG